MDQGGLDEPLSLQKLSWSMNIPSDVFCASEMENQNFQTRLAPRFVANLLINSTVLPSQAT
jgi:hypothetical protein